MPEKEQNILRALTEVIHQRRTELDSKSYTAKLLAGGAPKINEKVIEEANEVVEAALEPGEQGRDHLVREVADLLFHSMVLLELRDTNIHAVEAELGRRFGVSGLTEKASRSEQQQ